VADVTLVVPDKMANIGNSSFEGTGDLISDAQIPHILMGRFLLPGMTE